jgi:hypothetical protein
MSAVAFSILTCIARGFISFGFYPNKWKEPLISVKGSWY